MAKKIVKRRAGSTRKGATGKKGLNLAKVTIGLLLLVIIGYAGLAIYEGRIIPEGLDFEMDFFNGEEEPSPAHSTSPAKNTNSKTNPPVFDHSGFDLYFTKAFDFMWPAYAVDQQVIERPYYTLRYGAEQKQALWVAYAVNSDSLQLPLTKHQLNLKKDPRVKTGATAPSDFHDADLKALPLASADHFAYSEFALGQLNYTSLFSPVSSNFEKGAWSALNDQIKRWASQNGQVYVVRGPIFDTKAKRTDKARIAIPNAIYTIVLDIQRPEIKAIGFVLPNGENNFPLSNYAVSIDEIERRTGLDFFPTISDELENHLEKYLDTTGWF